MSKQKSDSSTGFGGCALIVLAGLIIWHCGRGSDESVKEEKEVSSVPVNADPYHFKHWLDKEYAFDIEIKRIQISTVKNAFKVQADKYAVPVLVDGKRLDFSFTITNPYQRDMLIKFPDGFGLAAEEFEYNDGGVDRKCDCYVVFRNSISTRGYKKTTLIEDNDTINIFKPHQSKTFAVTFDRPFRSNKVVIRGFDTHEREAERFWNRRNAYALIVDVPTQRLTRIQEFNRSIFE